MFLEKFELKNHCSIVTGAAQGLGKYMALALAEAGSNIVIPDVNIELAEKTAKEIEGKGVKAVAVSMDVRDQKEIGNMIDVALHSFGRIDVLINNAGICKHVDAEAMDYKDWLEVMNVNLNGVFLVSQAVGNVMIKCKKGSIINISSMSGIVVNNPQSQAAYNVSKAGVIMLTKSLASEWAEYNIRVNTIAPGYMSIGLTKKFFAKEVAITKRWISMTPMGRAGEAEELGGIAIYLASDASSYVTGGVFVVDGGYTVW